MRLFRIASMLKAYRFSTQWAADLECNWFTERKHTRLMMLVSRFSTLMVRNLVAWKSSRRCSRVLCVALQIVGYISDISWWYIIAASSDRSVASRPSSMKIAFLATVCAWWRSTTGGPGKLELRSLVPWNASYYRVKAFISLYPTLPGVKRGQTTVLTSKGVTGHTFSISRQTSLVFQALSSR